MDKEQLDLLHAVEQKELDRLNKLPLKELENEFCEWFQYTEDEVIPRNEMISDLMGDYMNYRRDDSDEELTYIIEN